jgi:uncharacterized protein
MTAPSSADGRATPFRILSLDGGGILGTFTAGFLAYIENQLEREGRTGVEARVGSYFDLIAGTSTGGIIAAGLAAGLSATTVKEFYEKQGKEVFTPRRMGRTARTLRPLADPLFALGGTDTRGFFGPTYESRKLSDQLGNLLKRGDGSDLLIGDLKRRLLLTAVQLSTGQTTVIKTDHIPGMIEHPHWTVRESVLATAAAPTFFQPAMIGKRGPFADGGLWANNPAMVAVAEAVRIARECQRDCDPKFALGDVSCLSIGTGEYSYAYDATESAGVKWWLTGKKIFTAMMASQSQGVNHQVRFMLGDRQYRRIDFKPQPDWTIDNVKAIKLLIDAGEDAGQRSFASPAPGGGPSVREQFFTQTAAEFVAFRGTGPAAAPRTSDPPTAAL